MMLAWRGVARMLRGPNSRATGQDECEPLRRSAAARKRASR